MLLSLLQCVPDLLRAFPFVLAFALLCARALKHWAYAFYITWGMVVAIVSVPAFISGFLRTKTPAIISHGATNIASLRELYPLVDCFFDLTTSAVTGVSFFLIVMFIGAMKKSSPVKKLFSIRSELSILGGIIVFGHCLRVLPYISFFASSTMITAFGTPGGYFMIAGCAFVGIPLFVCFVIAWVTSFGFIRRRMKPTTWKNVQKLAYPFMILMLAQGLCLAVAHGAYSATLAERFAAYSTSGVFGSYSIDVVRYTATALLYGVLIVAYLALKFLNRPKQKPNETVE